MCRPEAFMIKKRILINNYPLRGRQHFTIVLLVIIVKNRSENLFHILFHNHRCQSIPHFIPQILWFFIPQPMPQLYSTFYSTNHSNIYSTFYSTKRNCGIRVFHNLFHNFYSTFYSTANRLSKIS